MAFLEHVCKEGGETELQRLFQEHCGSSSGLTVKQAHERAMALMKEPLFQRVSEQGQNGVKAAAGLLKQVLSGQSPVVSGKASKFLKAVHNDLVNFVTEIDGGSAGSGDRPGPRLRGIPALKAKFAKMKTSKTTDVKELKTLCVFASVAFSEAERKDLMAWRDAALAKLPKANKAAAPVRARAKSRGKEHFDGDAQVMALLQG